MPVVWSPETRRHEPQQEVWVGVPTEGTELPTRVDHILGALSAHHLVGPTPHDDDVLHRVHAPAFVDHLRTVHAAWLEGPYDELVAQSRVVPYAFPTPALTFPRVNSIVSRGMLVMNGLIIQPRPKGTSRVSEMDSHCS